MAWTKQHVADFAYTEGDDWPQVNVGVLSDGTCCICYVPADGVHEANGAIGAPAWTDTVILSTATILANDPGGLSSLHYAARGSTRVLAYGTARTQGYWTGGFPVDPPPDVYVMGDPPQLWLGTNTGSGWSFSILHTYTEDFEYGYISPPFGTWGVYYDLIYLGGVGCAIAPDGNIGVLVTVMTAGNLHIVGGSARSQQVEFWSGGLTVIEHIDWPSGQSCWCGK